MRGCERPERSAEGKERVGGGTECRTTEKGLGKIGRLRGLRAPHRSRVNGNVLLRGGTRDEAGGSGCCRTSRRERQLPRFCGSGERKRVRVRAARRRESLFSLRPARSKPLWQSRSGSLTHHPTLCIHFASPRTSSLHDIRSFLPSSPITGLAGC